MQITESNTLYYGTIYDGRVFKVKSYSQAITSAVFFDEHSLPNLMQTTSSQDGLTAIDGATLADTISNALIRNVQDTNLFCPYNTINFYASHNSTITRSVYLHGTSSSLSLPKRVFLDVSLLVKGLMLV